MKSNKIFNALAEIKEQKLVIGKSTLGQEMLAFHIGKKEGKQILITSAIHAREFVSFFYCSHLIKSLAKKDLEFGIWFIPLVNPDGVRICLDGIDWIADTSLKSQLKKINKMNDFSLFKANANCVDLNVNFDADWGKGKQNVFNPAPSNYIGKNPNSEIETKNLIKIAKKIDILFTINFHTKGEIIYYSDRLDKNNKKQDKKLAEIISKLNNYEIIQSLGSAGGFSDWLEMRLNIPSLTIELGSDVWDHPIEFNKLKYIIKKNKKLELFLINPSVFYN